MSLAMDLLKRYPTAAPGTTPRRHTPKRGLHLARVPGVTQHRTNQRQWWAHAIIRRGSVHLGVHPTVHRARMAVRMWDYWVSQGFLPEEIPRKNITVMYR